jgi:hypothetical protein
LLECISLPDPHIDTEMGTKDDDNNSGSTGNQEKDEDESSMKTTLAMPHWQTHLNNSELNHHGR